jgi:hypothetical protein
LQADDNVDAGSDEDDDDEEDNDFDKESTFIVSHVFI